MPPESAERYDLFATTLKMINKTRGMDRKSAFYMHFAGNETKAQFVIFSVVFTDNGRAVVW